MQKFVLTVRVSGEGKAGEVLVSMKRTLPGVRYAFHEPARSISRKRAHLPRCSRIAILVMSLVAASCAALGPHESIQKQLEREYASVVAGFLRDDPSEWVQRLDPELHLTLFNGMVQDRDWAVEYVRNNARS